MATDRVERRLAAIVAADVASYSRLVAADEEAILAAQRTHRAEFIDPKFTEYGGRIANPSMTKAIPDGSPKSELKGRSATNRTSSESGFTQKHANSVETDAFDPTIRALSYQYSPK